MQGTSLAVLGETRPAKRSTFQRTIGDQFNGSSASFSGFRSDSLQAIFVGGKPTDSYSAHFILVVNTTLATVRTGEQIFPIKARQIFIVSFPNVIFVTPGRQMKTVPLTDLNWSIVTEQSRVGNSVNFRTHLAAPLVNNDETGPLVSFSVSLQSEVTQKPQSLPEIKINEDGTSSIDQKTTTGEQIQISLKMNHEFHQLKSTRYRNIVLPVHVRVFQQALVPRNLLETNFRPSDFSASEEATNGSTAPHVRLSASGLGDLRYSWVPTVNVDGKSFPVRVRSAEPVKASRKLQFNLTHVLFVRDWTIRKGLIYPYGQDVVHDPDIGITIFQAAEEVVSLSPSSQAYALLLALPILTAMVLILAQRKKYP